MRDTAQSLCKIADEAEPSHFLSVFPRWLDRTEWEKTAYQFCSPQEKAARLLKKLNFLRALDTKTKDLLHFESSSHLGSNLDLNTIRRLYKLGHSGHRFISVNLELIMATGYLSDDADSLWILAHSHLELIQLLAAESGLYIISNAE